ncbi:MAG: hypothetical protein ACOX6X_05050 [Dethiobacteria bacterium]
MTARIKNGSKKTVAVFTTAAMIFSIVKLPAAHAYFTATGESDALSFNIVQSVAQAQAYVSFINTFLIEESENGAGGEMVPMAFGAGTMDSPVGLLGDLFDKDPESIEEKLSAAGKIQAEIQLEDGFDAGEIYIPSVELHYGGHSASALSGKLNDEGKLVVDFDREEIAAWIEGRNGEIDKVTFSVTGEGYAGGLDRFLFLGEAFIKLKGNYETKAVTINGSDALFIPASGETVEEIYLLENQNGTVLESARWTLEDAVAKGVEIDCETGALVITSDAVPGAVTILAAIELENRILTARKTVELYEKPVIAISGVDTITILIGSVEVTGTKTLVIPGDEPLQEQYSALVLDPERNKLEGEPVTWCLENVDDAEGIFIDEEGLLTVQPGAEPGEYTVVATSVRDTGVSGSITVTLEALPQEAQEESTSSSSGSDMVEEDYLVLEGKTLILIPSGDETKTYTYTASGNNENLVGNIIFELQEEYPGVELDKDGVLTVDSSAAEGQIVLLASSRESGESESGEAEEVIEDERITQKSLTGKLVITLALPAPSSVQISGNKTVYIPVGDDDPQETVAYYTAAVLDQEGNPLEDEEVSWSLAETEEINAGVLLDEAGELRVTSDACPQSIAIMATSLSNSEVYGAFEVELVLAEAESPPAEEPENSGEDENSELYCPTLDLGLTVIPEAVAIIIPELAHFQCSFFFHGSIRTEFKLHSDIGSLVLVTRLRAGEMNGDIQLLAFAFVKDAHIPSLVAKLFPELGNQPLKELFFTSFNGHLQYLVQGFPGLPPVTAGAAADFLNIEIVLKRPVSCIRDSQV